MWVDRVHSIRKLSPSMLNASRLRSDGPDLVGMVGPQPSSVGFSGGSDPRALLGFLEHAKSPVTTESCRADRGAPPLGGRWFVGLDAAAPRRSRAYCGDGRSCRQPEQVQLLHHARPCIKLQKCSLPAHLHCRCTSQGRFVCPTRPLGTRRLVDYYRAVKP